MTTASPTAETLLSEANHRIANSLAAIAGLVRLQASDERRVTHLRSPSEVRFFLAEIGARIDAAAHLHRFLAKSEHTAQVEIVDFLQSIALSTVTANAVTGAAMMTFEGRARCLVPADEALTVGLILVELITNALKYAHPAGVSGAIWVRCDHIGERLVVEVCDDGVGLPEGFDWRGEKSLGFRLIRSMCGQLNGEFRIEDFGLGVRAVLTIPCQAQAPLQPMAIAPETEAEAELA